MSDVSREEYEFLYETVKSLVIRADVDRRRIEKLERKHENNLKDWAERLKYD